MSSITNSVVEEMKTELLESLNDKDEKYDTWWIQCKEVAATTFYIFTRYIGLFAHCILGLFVLGFIFLDIETIDQLRNISNEELAKGVDAILNLSFIISMFFLCISIAIGRIRYINVRTEKEKAIRARASFVADVGNIAEEILYRHKLIDLDENK